MSDYYIVTTEPIDGGWCIVVERADHSIRIGVEVWESSEATAKLDALAQAPDIAATLYQAPEPR